MLVMVKDTVSASVVAGTAFTLTAQSSVSVKNSRNFFIYEWRLKSGLIIFMKNAQCKCLIIRLYIILQVSSYVFNHIIGKVKNNI